MSPPPRDHRFLSVIASPWSSMWTNSVSSSGSVVIASTNSGSGLGLAISHRIIEEHRGRLVIKSTPGQGTTVRVFLPVNAGTLAGRLKDEGVWPTSAF